MKINVSDFFKALSCEQRIKIIESLKEGPKCICEIEGSFNIDKTTLSRHIKILSNLDIIEQEKIGTKKILSLKDKRVLEILLLAEKIIKNQ